MKDAKCFPKKTKTVNPIKKVKKTYVVKHTPGYAHPVEKKTENEAWKAEKDERRAMRKLAIIGRKAKKILPNKGMEDAQKEYELSIAYELIAAGDENGWTLLNNIQGKTETVAPHEVEPELFTVEINRIHRLEDAIKALPLEYERLNAKAEKAHDSYVLVHKRIGIAKMMLTKATKSYKLIAANFSGDEFNAEMAERYTKMIERKRHLERVIELEKKAKEEYEFRNRVVYEFAYTWIREEDRLNECLKNAEKKLEMAKLARKHERRQAILEDVFEQRYERAQYVPKKTDAEHYKVYSVKASKFYGAEVKHIIDQIKELVEDNSGARIPKEKRVAGWLVKGRALVAKLMDIIENDTTAFTFDVKDCIVNNVSRSQLSDIMGVEYGTKTPCKEILSVNYDLTGIVNIYWKFLSEDYEKAQQQLHNIRVKVAERMLYFGAVLTDGDKKVAEYKMLASSPSQQKKGQCYMGEKETMKHSEKLLEFGWAFDDAIEKRTDNAAEWLKRNATLMTPSKKILKDGKGIKITKILMMNDVDVERYLDNVTTIDGVKISTAERKLIKQTLFDGQGMWLKLGLPTTQARGTAIKAMIVALPEYKLPEYAIDIMENKVRIADYDVLMTKSCWKASKMGMNWYQFRDAVTELAKTCPGYDELYSVRYSDREIGDEENPRNLARQATQQWITMPDEDIEKLTRKTRRWLKNHKKYSVILSKLGEWHLPADERSAMAKLFNAVPQLITHPAIQQWLESWWNARRDKACSGRISTKGMYPYIVQDPIAMIQILLEGHDPNDENVGVVPAGMVNLPKVQSGRKVYAIRYPANYLVGMVLTQINVPEFRELGCVAVLSARDETIFKADGDFDGDEMLFIFDDLVIETMERIIKEYNPTLIDFPHGKVPCDKPFGTFDNFVREVAEALVRAQEFNLVGLYSNLAVICLQNASVARDPLSRGKWLTSAKVAHVGAIVCLDMVKGANVPEELKALLEKMNKNIRAKYKMPWNQQFSHRELGVNDVEKRSNSTQDRIAGMILDDTGKFQIEIDTDDAECWSESSISLFNVTNKTTSFRRFIVNEDAVRKMNGCHFEDAHDVETWNKINGLTSENAIGLKDWLMLGWHNASSMMWKMTGTDMVEKRNELYWFIREQIMTGLRTKWTRNDGYEFTMSEKYATFLRDIVSMTFGKMNGIDETKKGSFAMFMIRVFAQDLLCAFENQTVTEELAANMSAPREETGYIPSCMDDIDPESLHKIMDDGSIYVSVYNKEDPYYEIVA